MKLKDSRIKMMNEILNGIKVCHSDCTRLISLIISRQCFDLVVPVIIIIIIITRMPQPGV